MLSEVRYTITVAGDAEQLVDAVIGDRSVVRASDRATVEVEPRDHADLVSIVVRLHEFGMEILDLHAIDRPER